MKRKFKLSIILLAMMCYNAQPVSAKKSNKVYYVVVGSFSNLNNAIKKAKSWSGKQSSIYKTTVNGQTNYRVCPSSFSTNAKAKSYINNNGIDGWVWPSNGVASCVWSSGKSSSYAGSNNSSSNYTAKASTNSRIDELRWQMLDVVKKLQSEKEQYKNVYRRYLALMNQYGTTRTDPYFFDDMMGVLNRTIKFAEQGKKIATELGNYDMVKEYEKDLQLARNAKNYLIMNH